MRLQRVLLLGAAVLAAVVIGGRHYGDDVVVLGLFVLKNRGGRRAAVGLLAILLFYATFPPLEWPLFLAGLVPLVWLWRDTSPADRSWVGEAFGIGFAMCWLSSPFVRADVGTFGVVIHALASSLFGLQIIGVAAGLRATRHLPILIAAPLSALVAVSCELLRVVLLRWPLLVLGFPAAPTPLSQWAYYVTPFGVSYFLYVINFLWLPDHTLKASPRAWGSTVAAMVCLSLAWFGGKEIAARVRFGPMPFSALLVQPNRVVPPRSQGDDRGLPIAEYLDRLTRDALDEAAAVDLIIWPEAVLRRLPPPWTEQDNKAGRFLALEDFRRCLFPAYRTSCLVGAITETGHDRFNSACLLTRDGRTDQYNKRMLVVVAEQDFTPGGDYRCLNFVTKDGRTVRLGVSICYEMHFPWLPQYEVRNRPDVIVHLNNESWYKEYPGQHGHGTWACQYRAIETRTWQLVCATWTKSAVIDPTGKVVQILPASPGVLRVTSRYESNAVKPRNNDVSRIDGPFATQRN
jgi:apolipoprotein N-acyltransferase